MAEWLQNGDITGGADNWSLSGAVYDNNRLRFDSQNDYVSQSFFGFSGHPLDVTLDFSGTNNGSISVTHNFTIVVYDSDGNAVFQRGSSLVVSGNSTANSQETFSYTPSSFGEANSKVDYLSSPAHFYLFLNSVSARASGVVERTSGHVDFKGVDGHDLIDGGDWNDTINGGSGHNDISTPDGHYSAFGWTAITLIKI